MAALLAAMAVMAVLMTAALPTWKQIMLREKEDELIFRGEQYARAIGAYQRKFANASPPSIDLLVEQHFLRRKYKDPLAIDKDGEFGLIRLSNQSGSGASGAPQGGTAAQSGSLASSSSSNSGPIIGVVSKNPGKSLRTYKDHDHYNEWQFMALQQSTQGGTTGAGRTAVPFRAGGAGRQGGPPAGSPPGGRTQGPGQGR